MSHTYPQNMIDTACTIPAPVDAARLFAREERAEVRVDAQAKPGRYGFIDLLRGLALVVMIETHVVSAYLPFTLKKGSEFFFWLSFVNGLVAPGFLFAAGFSIVLQGHSQWENWLRFRLPFWKQMRRLGFIFLVAYFTHLQGFRLSRYLKNWGDPKMWARTFQVDVLQCIVVSLLVVHLLILLLRKKQRLPWGAGLLAGAVALATPWIWSLDLGRVPMSIALYFDPAGISLFPIFPWICFVLAGSCAGSLFLRSAEARKIPQFMQIAACTGIALIAGGLLLRNAPYTLPGQVGFYTTSPLYVMIRIGSILLVLALIYAMEAVVQWVPRPIEMAGRESLLVYGVHLWIIYALLRGKILGPVLGLKMGYAGCFFLSAAIILLMLFLARHWHDLKKNYPKQTRIAQASVVVTMITVFLLG